MILKRLAVIVLFAGACHAQRWEAGGAIGYGWYNNATIHSPGATAEAGIRNRVAAGFVLGEDLYEHISGEVRYTFHAGRPFVSSDGVSTEIQGQSHALSYDSLFHFRRREDRFRPYLQAGLGAKDYVITGPVPIRQPLASLGILTDRDQWKFLVVVGGGVKYRVARHVILRVDFLDYLTAFPRRQIAPPGRNSTRGILQQFTPLFGVSGYF